ncbi:MAG: ATP-dependent DNA helicase RecG [Burkholderiaceae bacterium]|nr:ATP-dependent DNA helicase RecG [Burkholderiaceae bacterium]
MKWKQFSHSLKTLPKVPTAGKPALNASPINLKLAKLGLRRQEDFLLHLPIRYEDETTVTPIADLIPGEQAQIEVEVVHSEVTYRPRRQMILRVQDHSGELVLRFINFYGSQLKAWGAGSHIRARGEVRGGFFGTEMVHPQIKKLGEQSSLPTTLTPVYSTMAGVPQTLIRRAIDKAFSRLEIEDYLPPEWMKRLELWPLRQSLETLHHPPQEIKALSLQDRSHPAWQRIKFDELLAQQLSLRKATQARRARVAPILQGSTAPAGSFVKKFLQILPFELTTAQQRVWKEILGDLKQAYPMHRLLQGDVGSGKTVIAALACLQAIDHNYQAVLMAPTEILAEQHFRKIADWLTPLGIRVAWLTGSLKKSEKTKAQQVIAEGSAQLIIGTHALIQEKVSFAQLGLAVIDEQHRFGVSQRLHLRKQGGVEPHILTMSATPIPRTLAMTYFADLEVSVIDELPPGRSPILTKVVTHSRKAEVIERVRAWTYTGQVYWVVPLIEESETLELQNALDAYAELTSVLAPIPVGLIHGRMPAAEKQAVMDAFIGGTIRVLVATTVIEVGVDVPSASLMIIEHAERFGLAQLHQLRGRVGRGTAQSVCVLMYSPPLSQTARERLKTMRLSSDGFEISRKDLQLRGPGEFLGARQSGLALLRFADLDIDTKWVELARQCAQDLLTHHASHVEACLKWWMGGREEYLKA